MLPHAWITGDDEMGRNSGFRDALRTISEQYLLAVPSNTSGPRSGSPHRRPTAETGRPPKVPFQRADTLMKAAKNWTRIEVRPGEKGPLVVEVLKVRVQTKLGRRNGPEETLVIFRERQGRKTIKQDLGLSNAPFDTPLREFARVLNAEHRIEECLRRAKGEAGLAQYQVRTWEGWHHHQTLTLIGHVVLDAREAAGGKRCRHVCRSRRYETSSDNCCMRNCKPTPCNISAIAPPGSTAASKPPTSTLEKTQTFAAVEETTPNLIYTVKIGGNQLLTFIRVYVPGCRRYLIAAFFVVFWRRGTKVFSPFPPVPAFPPSQSSPLKLCGWIET